MSISVLHITDDDVELFAADDTEKTCNVCLCFEGANLLQESDDDFTTYKGTNDRFKLQEKETGLSTRTMMERRTRLTSM